MQVDQSEGTKEIPRNVEVLARSTTSNKTGHQTHQWNLIFHQSKGQKAMIRQKVRERLTVWETSRNGNRMSSKARLSQLQWKKQTCFAMELATSWWWGSAHWLSRRGQTGLQKSIPLGLALRQSSVVKSCIGEKKRLEMELLGAYSSVTGIPAG